MNLEKFKELFRKEWTFSQSEKIKAIIRSFSIGEKVAFYALVFIFIFSSLALLWKVNQNFLVEVPAYGGTITEGVVGSPRFVNPLLATSEADKDLSSLIYSGLLKEDSNGNLTPDLAESYSVSDDGLTYTFILKDNAKFQDGSKITADDILFTVERAQDNGLRSPKESAWSGVKAEKIDDKTVTFTLKQPYSPFIYNAKLGILPKHIWKGVGNDSFPFSALNIKPVGSGPYSVSKVVTDSSGLPTEYHLKANKKYISGEPYISDIILKFYQNEYDLINAYNRGDIEGINSITPQNMAALKNSSGAIKTASLGRVFGIFFNQNQNPVLVNKEVRVALDMALDKQAIVDKILNGYGTVIDGPIASDTAEKDGLSQEQRLSKARDILEKAGWTKDTDGIYQKQDKKNKKNNAILSLSLSTGDAPELKAAAETIQKTWSDLGAKVDVKIFEIGDLNQNIIRTRKYDSLLFGEIVPAGLDLYPFWSSSQRNDPGLNVAMYTNIKADAILDNMRKVSDQNKLGELEKDFETQIKADEPSIFLYSPYFIYLTSNKIHNIELPQLTSASDRLANVDKWYIETNHVWKLFAK